MKPGARIQAAIEIIDIICESMDEGGAAADQIVRQYFARRRYAGSKDRRAVRHQVYWILRRRGEIEWRLQQAGKVFSGRWALLTAVVLPHDADTFMEEGIEALFTGGKYSPEEPNEDEQAFVAQVQADPQPELPDWAVGNYPDWMDASLKNRFGSELPNALEGLAGRATLDLRVNLLKASQEKVLAALEGAQPTKWSPNCVRLEVETNIQSDPAFREGWVDIQDEGSQLAALLTGVLPGMTVLDYCAGAGGKSLAMSAAMNNEGSIYAYDSATDRLERINPRAKRLFVDNINIIKKLEPIFKDMDKVVLDVPCSGTGTWRRSPELRWRLTSERLEEYRSEQQTILLDGSNRVAIGGQLIYITCSLLPEEDEQQIEWFLEQQSGFKLVPYGENLSSIDGELPETLSSIPECLLLAPHKHDTDGFFVAVLERVN